MQSISTLIKQTYKQSVPVLMKMIALLLLFGLADTLVVYFLAPLPDVSVAFEAANSMALLGAAIAGLAVFIIMYVVYYQAYYELNTSAKKKASFLGYIFATLGYGLLAGIATLFLVIPGIYVAIKLIPAPYYYLANGGGFKKALSQSWAATDGKWWAIFGRVLAFGIMIGIVYSIVAAIIYAITNTPVLPYTVTTPTLAQLIGTFLLAILGIKVYVFNYIYGYNVVADLKK